MGVRSQRTGQRRERLAGKTSGWPAADRRANCSAGGDFLMRIGWGRETSLCGAGACGTWRERGPQPAPPTGSDTGTCTCNNGVLLAQWRCAAGLDGAGRCCMRRSHPRRIPASDRPYWRPQHVEETKGAGQRGRAGGCIGSAAAGRSRSIVLAGRAGNRNGGGAVCAAAAGAASPTAAASTLGVAVGGQ